MGGASPDLERTHPPSPRNGRRAAGDVADCRLELAATRQLHQRLQAEFPRRSNDYARALHEANEELHRRKITFGGSRDMATGLSALQLDHGDVGALQSAASLTYGLIEKTLDWLAASPERMTARFPHLARVLPFLCPTAGWDRKQVASRYDAVITPAGELKIIELNTCCPAGFLHSETFCRVTQEALGSLGVDGGIESLTAAAIDPDALLEGMFQIEQSAGLEPAMFAALIDENEILHELDLLTAAAREMSDRPIEILDARQLEYAGGRLTHRGRPISLAYNKFRISVPTSKNHCWRSGFEERYGAYLQAMAEGAVASVNNLYAMTLGEDKGLLALWRDPELAAQFSAEERSFIERHVAWTHPLAPAEVDWRGRALRLPEDLLKHREHFVIKPASEGRGYGVVIGKYADDEAWRAACTPDPATPSVVQEFIEPVALPVVVCRDSKVTVEPMFLTVGLASVCGRYRGLLSRVSPSPVTNVARTGMVQAVLAPPE